MRVAIYTRVSSVEQSEEGWSLAAQENTLKQYCDLHNHDIVKIYTDAGISGKNIFKRPEVQKLLVDAENNLFDVVLIWKLSRLTRRMKDLINICELLESQNINLISYSENFDNASPSGKMLRNIIGVVAEFERETISENVKLATLERVRSGRPACSYVLGYDLINGELVVNTEEAKIVNNIFDIYKKEQSLLETTRKCESLRYYGKTGKPIKKAEKIRVILTRPIYVGYNTLHGMIFKGSHEPIVDMEKFVEVQNILRTRGQTDPKYLQFFLI